MTGLFSFLILFLVSLLILFWRGEIFGWVAQQGFEPKVG
jgi:hypothetical protein